MTLFTNSYIITARGLPSSTYYLNIAPLPDNELWFYTALGQYEPDASNYRPVSPAASQTPPPGFLNALTTDLNVAAANNCRQLTVIIHGLGNLFTDAVTEMTTLGSGLQQYANYYRLVLSF